MTGSHAQQNAEIILVLSKMGIYMERDRKRLDCLSPAAQNTRLKKALDRAVENCCIFPLMFSKETREMGNLVLSDLPEWAGWRTSRKEILHASKGDGAKAFVNALGTHSVYAPFQMGQYSVTESALVQGASVRLKEDVPHMEGLLSRWLGFTSAIDMVGGVYPGGYWGLASASGANTPSARTACLAVQLLAVLQVQLPEDIDDVQNETGHKEMKDAGYRGNTDRRAIPIIVVRYATALPSLGSQKNVKTLINFAKLPEFDITNTHLTPTQFTMFSRILDSNNRRLSPSETAKYQARAPNQIAKETKISFISPLYCPGADLADQLEIGRRPRLSCAVCEIELGADVKLFFCAGCSGVTYCSAGHQSEDWPSHKAACRPKTKTPKVPIATHLDPGRRSSPIAKILLPLEYRSASERWGSRFVNYTNPAERLKPPRKAYEKPQCAKTIYAHGERFLVRARWGGHADRMFGVQEADRRSGNLSAAKQGQQDPAFLDFFMSILHFVDRPNSFGILMQKQTGRVGNMMMMPYDIHNIDANMASGDVDNTAIFEAVVAIIKRSEKDKAEAAYFWATRKGDCVEVDLVDLPDQALGW